MLKDTLSTQNTESKAMAAAWELARFSEVGTRVSETLEFLRATFGPNTEGGFEPLNLSHEARCGLEFILAQLQGALTDAAGHTYRRVYSDNPAGVWDNPHSEKARHVAQTGQVSA